MASRKAKSDRACGYCQKKDGHNARTCAQKKLDESTGVVRASGGEDSSNGAGVAPPPPSSSSALTSRVESRPFVSGTVHHVHAPHEFEESRKQVHANGTTMSAAMREYAAGATSVALRFQDESDEKPVEKVLDIEKAGKLLELLTWCMQRHAAKMNATAKTLPASRTNGLPTRQPAA